ncbi:MAG: hypothetical protein ACE5G9_05285, partial [Nitrospinales bacterium]
FQVGDLQERCSRELSKFKQPKKIIVIDEFPKSSSGKIQKKNLKTLYGDHMK